MTPPDIACYEALTPANGVSVSFAARDHARVEQLEFRAWPNLLPGCLSTTTAWSSSGPPSRRLCPVVVA